MAKLRKTSGKKTSQPATQGAPVTQGNSTLLIGIVLAVAVGILFWVLTSQIQAKDQVMVAKGDIPAFSNLSSEMVVAQTVPKNSITKSDITAEQYKSLVKQGRGLINRVEILQGQRINVGAVSASSAGSIGAVKPDERLVAVNATFPGVVAGLARAGSVVDVYAGAGGGGGDQEGGGAIADNVKVIALGSGATAAANVRTNKQLNESKESGGAIVAVLAVPTEDAASILALSQVALALDPRYSFTPNGTVCQVNRCSKLEQSEASGQSSTPDTGLPGSTDQPSGTDQGTGTDQLPDSSNGEQPTPDQPSTEPQATPDQPSGGQ